jgi:hypothetical protein
MGGRDDIDCRTVDLHVWRAAAKVDAMSAFHDFEMTSITGDQVGFDRFRGQICIVVNVASA